MEISDDYAFIGPSDCFVPLGDAHVKTGERVGRECEELQITQQHSAEIDVLNSPEEYSPDADPSNNEYYDVRFFWKRGKILSEIHHRVRLGIHLSIC